MKVFEGEEYDCDSRGCVRHASVASKKYRVSYFK